MCRGYYTRTVLAAFDWNGKELKNRWVFDSNHPGCEQYAGQGNHNPVSYTHLSSSAAKILHKEDFRLTYEVRQAGKHPN